MQILVNSKFLCTVKLQQISEAVKSNRVYAMVISYKKEQQGVARGTGIPNSKSIRWCHYLFSHSSRKGQ